MMESIFSSKSNPKKDKKVEKLFATVEIEKMQLLLQLGTYNRNANGKKHVFDKAANNNLKSK